MPIGDGDSKDRPKELCVDVVDGDLPHCMDMIGVEDVVKAIECYLEGGVAREMEKKEWDAVAGHLS